MLGDFNAPGISWESRQLMTRVSYYVKCKLKEVLNFVDSMNLEVILLDSGSVQYSQLDLILSDIGSVGSECSLGLVRPDCLHPAFTLKIANSRCIKLKGDHMGWNYRKARFLRV